MNKTQTVEEHNAQCGAGGAIFIGSSKPAQGVEERIKEKFIKIAKEYFNSAFMDGEDGKELREDDLAKDYALEMWNDDVKKIFQSEIKANDDKWKTKLHCLKANIPITKGLADGGKIREDINNLLKEK